MLLQARGDQEAARQAFQQAAALAPTRRRTSFVAHHDVQAQLWSRLGDSQAASQWARAIGLDEEDDLSYLNETAHIEFARSLIAQGRLGDAGRLLDRLETESTGAGRIGRLIEIHILQARAFQAAGDQGAALAAILQALSLAEPEGAVRVFADEGPELLQLVKIAGEMTPESRLAIYARKLAGTFESPASAQGKEARPLSQAAPAPLTDLVESLSQREQEILRLIARGLSNDEIARSLFLAASTVHWHVKNLYGKLGVHSRTQAVLRAGELGLLA
jgi:LuxR family maltose regulon positive regulatory protein